MSEHLNAQHDERHNEYVLCGESFFQNWNSNESQGAEPPSRFLISSARLAEKTNIAIVMAVCRKQQSVAGADLKQTEINYVSMREPKKILVHGEKNIQV